MSEKNVLKTMHQLLLEALRHREQEIVPYLAIIGPALGGFVWLLSKTDDPDVFGAGTIGVVFLLLVGAVYSLALGYNYRYITLELAKLEAKLGITDAMLKGWPREPKDFRRYVLWPGKPVLGSILWCTPPEIIKVFWRAFIVAIGGVSTAAYYLGPDICFLPIGVAFGLSIVIAWGVFPWWFGRKLYEKYTEEEKLPTWPDPPLPNRIDS